MAPEKQAVAHGNSPFAKRTRDESADSAHFPLESNEFCCIFIAPSRGKRSRAASARDPRATGRMFWLNLPARNRATPVMRRVAKGYRCTGAGAGQQGGAHGYAHHQTTDRVGGSSTSICRLHTLGGDRSAARQTPSPTPVRSVRRLALVRRRPDRAALSRRRRFRRGRTRFVASGVYGRPRSTIPGSNMSGVAVGGFR